MCQALETKQWAQQVETFTLGIWGPRRKPDWENGYFLSSTGTSMHPLTNIMSSHFLLQANSLSLLFTKPHCSLWELRKKVNQGRRPTLFKQKEEVAQLPAPKVKGKTLEEVGQINWGLPTPPAQRRLLVQWLHEPWHTMQRVCDDATWALGCIYGFMLAATFPSSLWVNTSRSHHSGAGECWLSALRSCLSWEVCLQARLADP